jgi:PleD family two-component response regulator
LIFWQSATGRCSERFNAKKLPHFSHAAKMQPGEPAVVENVPVVLLVEDDPLIQSVVKEALTEGGFEIVIASSGDQAMDLLD